MNVRRVGEEAPAFPPVQSGFEHISRTWDDNHRICAARILPGEYYVTSNDEMITTVLGSCVSACVRDPATGIGGMNHFILPEEKGRNASSGNDQKRLATRYGIAAMQSLVDDVLRRGGQKNELEIKLFGGGNILNMSITTTGQSNIDFVHQFVQAESMKVCAEDLGGPYPRKVNYFPKTGKVLVKRLRSLQCKAIVHREREYQEKLAQTARPVGT